MLRLRTRGGPSGRYNRDGQPDSGRQGLYRRDSGRPGHTGCGESNQKAQPTQKISRKMGHTSRRSPGHRPTDIQILRGATGWSSVAVAVGTLIAAAALWWWQGPAMAASVAIGAALVVASNVLNVIAQVVVVRWLPRAQGAALTSVFVLKLVLLCAVLAAVFPLPWLNKQAFFIAFALAVGCSLVVSSAVVMREPGPGIDAGNGSDAGDVRAREAV